MAASEQQLEGRVADLLKQKPLLDVHRSNLADSYRAAVNDVLGALQARGFSPTQARAWDRFDEYVTDIGEFWFLTRAGLLGNYSDLFVQKLDRRKELTTAPVMVGGVLVEPGSAAAGFGVGGGRLDDSTYRINADTEF